MVLSLDVCFHVTPILFSEDRESTSEIKSPTMKESWADTDPTTAFFTQHFVNHDLFLNALLTIP